MRIWVISEIYFDDTMDGGGAYEHSIPIRAFSDHDKAKAHLALRRERNHNTDIDWVITEVLLT